MILMSLLQVIMRMTDEDNKTNSDVDYVEYDTDDEIYGTV